jgi:hypothetical protein
MITKIMAAKPKLKEQRKIKKKSKGDSIRL